MLSPSTQTNAFQSNVCIAILAPRYLVHKATVEYQRTAGVRGSVDCPADARILLADPVARRQRRGGAVRHCLRDSAALGKGNDGALRVFAGKLDNVRLDDPAAGLERDIAHIKGDVQHILRRDESMERGPPM